MDTCKHEIENCTICDPTLAPETAPVRLPDAPPRPRRAGVRYWSPEEDELAQDLTATDDDLADLLGRTPMAVHLYRLARGYIAKTRERRVAKAPRAMARWTAEEIKYARQRHLEEATDEQIGHELGRSADAVHRRLSRGE